MKKPILTALFTIIIGTLFAQDYPISAIPDSLKKGALCVVRFESCSFELFNLSSGVEKVTKVITILEEKGNTYANVDIPLDKFSQLKSFKGEIILESGKVFKKVTKWNLTTTELSTNLSTDDYTSFYSCTSPSYPYTFSYSYEVEKKDGIWYFPSFIPSVPNISVQKAIHSIKVPKSITLLYRSNELSPIPQKVVKNGDTTYTWSVENKSAIKIEPMAPEYLNNVPFVNIIPEKFIIEGFEGNFSSWQSTGMFLTKLLENRNELPESTILKIKELTTNDRVETIKRIYDYLQKTTRYVSIQLGIGGYQPIKASDVAINGFGDCKALTNYMKAMLAVANIESEYCIVNTYKREFYKDFSSLNQANHVILLVPNQKDSIWLECTSKDNPFNYVHTSIAGHDVLTVNGDKSKLLKVRDIPDELNSTINNVTINLNPETTTTIRINKTVNCHNIEDYLEFVLFLDEKEKVNLLSEELHIQNLKIENIKTEYIKTSTPQIRIDYTINTQKFLTRSQSRLFVPINPFRDSFGRVFTSENRKFDIQIDEPVFYTDSVNISIPKGYIIEALPKPITHLSKFGKFKFEIQADKNQILLVFNIEIPKGKFPPSDYSDIRTFFGIIDKCFGNNLILKKTE